MKRGFIFSLIGFVFFVIIVSIVWYNWPKPSDTIYEDFRDQEWESVIKQVRALPEPSPYDLLYASQSLLFYNAGLKELDPEDQLKSANKFSQKFKIQYTESEIAGNKFPIFEDPFIGKLAKKSFLRSKALVARLENAAEWDNAETLAKYIRELLSINPLPILPSYSTALKNSLKSDRITKLSESDRSELGEILGFLSTREDSNFFSGRLKNTGENTNLRIGPGTENPGKARLKKGAILYVLDKDPRIETISGKKGNWIQVYIPESALSGWMFSTFTEEEPFSNEKSQAMVSKYTESEKSKAWDFAYWDENSPPFGFFGKYIQTEKLAIDGDYGIVIYGSEKNDYQELCRLIEEPFRSLEFKIQYLSGEETVPVFRLYAGQSGSWNHAYQIDLDRESIYINRNKYILENKSDSRNFQIQIAQNANSQSASLFIEEKAVVQGIRPEQGFESSDETRYKLCLLQSKEKNKSNLALFRFRFLY
ncbi:hypothetical protein CH373_14475 [Leptospira perolatii]|uniref:SH3b domain-containing protein n=1 Tax=Leptospira perolatii TaxID=2023191 RepID=A0A2M9ZJY2_9LEPT|nr:SH3 domain-containing protein [Leptospira perolatii]PJZ69261.1 hypothetical protein CH360_12145 [Leptospira perolatii]PJZ72357.1 hypothetical protein CH373_14475 [Leptospira perolatii]